MKLSAWAVRRRVTTSMICLGIVLLGSISYRQLPLQLFPDVVYPGMGIHARLREATPREMEEELTVPIENAVASLPGVRKIESWTGFWGCWTNVEFDFGTDMRFSGIELSERLEVLKKRFPKERLEYGVFQWDTNDLQNRFFMELCVTGEGSPEMLRDVVMTRIKQRLEEVDGIYNVELGGVEPREMGVTLDPRRMRHYQVPFFQLVQRIQSWSNEKVYLGKLQTAQGQAYVRLAEKFGSAEELAALTVDPKTRLRLSDVAEVAESAGNQNSLYRVNGRPSIGLQLEKEAGANPLRTAARVEKVLERINAGQLPPGYSVEILQSQAEILSRIMAKIAKLALTGIALAVVVLFVFVRHGLITLTVVLAIPLSIFGTFNFMYANGMTINILSMVGITLAIGMLVDNSIVVLENIYRNYQLGKSRLEAACQGADEVGRAITASTLTTVIAFAPIFFLHGEVRLIFREMGLSIVFPLLISLLVAITFVPMATYFILSIESRRRQERLAERRRRGFFRRAYVLLLSGSLRHRGRLLAVVGLVIFFTWAFQRNQLDQGYLERNLEEDVFNVHITMPEGSQRASTDKVVREVEAILAQKSKFPEIKRFSAWVYDDRARIVVRMDPDVAGRVKEQLKEAILDETEGVPLAEIGFRRRRMDPQAGMVGFGESGRLELRGPDYDVLLSVAARVEAFLLTIPGIREVANDLSTGAPEVRLQIDREKASLLKINALAIQQAVLSANASGHVSQVRLYRGEDDMAVVFRLEGADTRILADLRQVDVWSADGRAFPLEDVAAFTLGDSPGFIHRRDQERIAAITFTTDNVRKKTDVIADIKRLGSYVVLPPGYSFELEGEQRQIDEMLASLRQVLLLGFLLVYMVMAGLFEAFFAPFVIMFTVPLAIVGAIWALLLTGHQYDAMAAMGSIFLLGIVVNNGIVFMDFVSMLRRRRNYGHVRAILTAGQYRLRPIFMTSLTTILGLLPLALKTGESNPWRPLAWVGIGGMSVSTRLTLVVLPAEYLTLERTLDRWRCLARRGVGVAALLFPRA
ncbi:efflux RND transporter permease subunit [bacterium]|nr:efflux RND transporter permease subunit [bacterium]